jgi:hypothetical protein
MPPLESGECPVQLREIVVVKPGDLQHVWSCPRCGQGMCDTESGSCVHGEGSIVRHIGSEMKGRGRRNAAGGRRKPRKRVEHAPIPEVSLSAEVSPTAQTDPAPGRQPTTILSMLRPARTPLISVAAIARPMITAWVEPKLPP